MAKDKKGSSPDKDGEPMKIGKDNIGFQNRPYMLNIHLAKQNMHMTDPSKSKVEHLFRIEFEPSVGVPPCWIDTKTLNYLNSLRSNIFASSSQYDRLQAARASESQDKKKKKTEIPSPIQVDKKSLAYMKGKRSCTVGDIVNYKPTPIIKQI